MANAEYIVCEYDSGPYAVTYYDSLEAAEAEYSEVVRQGSQAILGHVLRRSNAPEDDRPDTMDERDERDYFGAKGAPWRKSFIL